MCHQGLSGGRGTCGRHHADDVGVLSFPENLGESRVSVEQTESDAVAEDDRADRLLEDHRASKGPL